MSSARIFFFYHSSLKISRLIKLHVAEMYEKRSVKVADKLRGPIT